MSIKGKHLLSFVSLVLATILFAASTTTKKATTQLIIPVFDYSPTSPVAPGSAGLKIAFFKPSYSGNFEYANRSPFKQFKNSMSVDFEEILSSRGYIIKGPYEAYDFMTYSDKNECELGLFIDLDLNIQQTSGGWKVNPGFGSYTVGNQIYQGTLDLSGKISIYVRETFTKQQLLVKSVPVPQYDLHVKSEGKYDIGSTGIPVDDPGIHNPISKALAEFYKTTMQQAWDLLDKDELLHIKKQVPQIRKEAGFIKS